MERKTLPLLEFDESPEKVTANMCYSKKTLPEKCVIAFFKNEVLDAAEKYSEIICGKINTCTVNLPVYELDFNGEKIALVCGFLGSAGAAAQLEELIAMGATKFVVCGAAGTLTENPLGALVVCNSAVRDEGTSFHYLPPSYEIEADGAALKSVIETLNALNIPYKQGKTWTTDAIFRETTDKILLRREQGCITVDMEASALMAVARVRGVKLAQIMYCGDDLSREDYDIRNFYGCGDIRRALIDISLQCVKKF